MVNRKQTGPIPEAIAQLQRQLDQFRSSQSRRAKLPEPLWQAAVELAREHGIYSVAHPLRLDYMGLKKRLGGISPFARQGNQDDIRGTNRATSHLTTRVRDRFGMPERTQNAHPMEGFGAARLDQSAACLAGSGRMIQIAAQVRILVAVEAIDGRKGIDAIAQLCREKLDTDPFSGYLFIFRTRRGTAIRVLQFDGQGFWLATKRLSKGGFRWWPTGTEPAQTLRVHPAQLLLAAGNPEAEAPPAWRPVNAYRKCEKHLRSVFDSATLSADGCGGAISRASGNGRRCHRDSP